MAEHANLLFELGTEELPPTTLKRLSEALNEEFIKGLDDAQLAHGEVTAYATPRRLAVLVLDCALAQADRDIERRGPALAAAFDDDGKPTKAAEGFARSCGTTVDQLNKQTTGKGTWLMYQVHQTGQQAAELLPGIAENALSHLPIAKRMRWGTSEAQFVRPVHWLVFLHGDHVVPCTLLDAQASNQTRGHRFHHPAAITLYNPEDYADVLESLGKVIANFDDRRSRIKQAVEKTAEGLGGRADLDDDLLDEVTGLNEWPQPIAGSFEAEFLSVPQEALVATMKSNQKYFPVFDQDDRLMNHFITIANLESSDPQTIRQGNERVIRPRLSDAKFFWDQDGKHHLSDHIVRLDQVVFQKGLGSMREKSERVAALAEFIAGHTGADPVLARRAGELSRCDLMTEMVNEFPEMQGIMGRYQATRDGESAELAQALDEFYMPRFSGDALPQTPTGIAIALAERIDTLVGVFGIGMKPSGDKDPFALRRAALGALRILREHALPLSLTGLIGRAAEQLGDSITVEDTPQAVYDFMLERLKGLYLDSGVPLDVFEAVASVHPESVADFEHRVRAVGDFSALPEAQSLAAANKRIANILKKADGEIPDAIDPALFELTAEQTLHLQIEAVAERVQPLMANANYGATLQALSSLRAPVDTFFDDVMVMADKPEVRGNRLAMLDSLARQFLQVADISLLNQQPG